MFEMSDSDFRTQLQAALGADFREDFEVALNALYENCASHQRMALRELAKSGRLKPLMPWRNATDFFRSDLTRQQRLRRALLALSMSGISNDYRDDILTLGWCYHNARLFGWEPEQLFGDVGRMSDESVAKFLRDFLRRRPEDLSLSAFGLRIEQTAAGPVAEL